MARTQSPDVTKADMQQCMDWTGGFLASPAALPISFTYGGKQYRGIPAEFAPKVRTRRIDACIIATSIEGRDRATGLLVRAEIVRYLDFPVVEWTVYFTNEGTADTPILSDVQGLDADFVGTDPVLWHSNGDYYSIDGYTPYETPLNEGASVTVAPNGGRSCNGAFPYFRVMTKDAVLTFAVGWPAQWSATFSGTATGAHITAGQQLTRMKLLPGETIRTPRITLLAATGDMQRSINVWRRWYQAHVLPRADGQPLPQKLVAHAVPFGDEFTEATEENQIAYMEKFAQKGYRFSVWWIDAGWYPCRMPNGKGDWPTTGTWIPDPPRFPRGFKPVSDAAHRHGADLLIWFEPERVRKGTQIDREHPEWLLALKSNPDNLDKCLNLGNPACRQWLTDHVSTLIQEGGIDIYRQDHNFDPLEFWRQNDAEDRQGANENLHVQGYLQYWDDLLARNPGLWIDSCASGGRRNDLETMRRSVPLHYTDFGYGIHYVKLSFHHTLYQWIPYIKECTLSWDKDYATFQRFEEQIDRFAFHCGIAAMTTPAVDINRDDYDYAQAAKLTELAFKTGEYFIHGDYYPLTPFARAEDKWVVRQFHRAADDTGFVQGIRLQKCPDDSITVFPQGLDDTKRYVFEDAETGEKREVSGAALRVTGFTLKQPVRSGAVWMYKLA